MFVRRGDGTWVAGDEGLVNAQDYRATFPTARSAVAYLRTIFSDPFAVPFCIKGRDDEAWRVYIGQSPGSKR